MADWRTYDDAAPDYTKYWESMTAEAAGDLVQLAEVRPGERLLDVGTGAGVVLERAAAALDGNGVAVGVDASLPMVQAARAARPAVRVVAAQAIDLPFRDAAFDVVSANFVLHHFSDPRTALFDMLRVLRPNGRMVVSTWGNNNDEYRKAWDELVEGVVGADLLADAAVKTAPGRGTFADRTRLEEVLYRAGLRQLRIEPREYRRRIKLEELIRQLELGGVGRFVRSMLGETGWETFRNRARTTFAERFADPLTDFSRAWVARGSKSD
jgi:SAM-dependent methyltransferase